MRVPAAGRTAGTACPSRHVPCRDTSSPWPPASPGPPARHRACARVLPPGPALCVAGAADTDDAGASQRRCVCQAARRCLPARCVSWVPGPCWVPAALCGTGLLAAGDLHSPAPDGTSRPRRFVPSGRGVQPMQRQPARLRAVPGVRFRPRLPPRRQLRALRQPLCTVARWHRHVHARSVVAGPGLVMRRGAASPLQRSRVHHLCLIHTDPPPPHLHVLLPSVHGMQAIAPRQRGCACKCRQRSPSIRRR